MKEHRQYQSGVSSAAIDHTAYHPPQRCRRTVALAVISPPGFGSHFRRCSWGVKAFNHRQHQQHQFLTRNTSFTNENSSNCFTISLCALAGLFSLGALAASKVDANSLSISSLSTFGIFGERLSLTHVQCCSDFSTGFSSFRPCKSWKKLLPTFLCRPSKKVMRRQSWPGKEKQWFVGFRSHLDFKSEIKTSKRN